MKKSIFKILIAFSTLVGVIFFYTNIYATEMEEIKENIKLDDVINSLEDYAQIEDVDIKDMTQNLIKGEKLDYGVIGNFITENLFSEIQLTLKTSILILIVIVIMAIIQSIELENSSSVCYITSLVGFLIIVTLVLKNYIDMVSIFLEVIKTLTKILEVVSPVLLSILIATGEITTSGIISPIVLFLTTIVGVVITYVVTPLLTISLVFKILDSISVNVKLQKIGSFLGSTSMWIVAVIFALTLAVLELETSVSTSVDEVAVKTTQAAVSNLVPVVGKFVSDSLEIVMGASEIIGKAVGVIGIIVLIIVSVLPVIKLIIVNITYSLLEGFSEALGADKKIVGIVGAFKSQYKCITGILIGVILTFVIALGIIIKLLGSVSGG